MITLYKHQPWNISVKYDSNPLSVYSKTYADISEIYMGLKLDYTDADDKYLQKLKSADQVILDEATHSFTMKITETDYTKLLEETTYKLVLGVKVEGIEKMLELEMADSDVKIVADKIRS